jgi:histidinol phosphatase-like enzyme
MIQEFEKQNIKISKVYYCPHHPDFTGECECRKPKPKMILDAQQEFNIDLAHSILVGDKNSDIEAGINAGIKNLFLVKTGHIITTNKFNVPILNNIRELINRGSDNTINSKKSLNAKKTKNRKKWILPYNKSWCCKYSTPPPDLGRNNGVRTLFKFLHIK